jgi:hypothetical protein
MAKRKAKAKQTAEEIEADRIAAYMESPLHAEVTPEQDAAIKRAEEAVNEALGSATPLAEREPVEMEETFEPDAGVVEGEEPEKEVNSVVAVKYKDNYIANAKANGIAGKAARRSNWDWLSQAIAQHCLGEKEKIDIAAFTDLLDANGVDHSKWTNRNKGWEGRFRMTGRVVLQKKVAEAGVLKTMVGEMVPPSEWVAKYKKTSE